MPSKQHWEQVYRTKAPTEVSWFQQHAKLSLSLIQDAGVALTASIIDVGGGASTLVDDLLAHGYRNVTVLDISRAALAAAQARLGADAKQVRWLETDVLEAALPARAYDVWHDRAVFHFLTTTEQRANYVQRVTESVKPGGLVLVATFAEDGPTQCSGLPVVRYSVDELHAQFGAAFTLLRHTKESHQTPAGKQQQFVYCLCRKMAV